MALICVLLELNVNFFLWKDYDKINVSHLSNGQNLLFHGGKELPFPILNPTPVWYQKTFSVFILSSLFFFEGFCLHF